jgi:hypothetical protein
MFAYFVSPQDELRVICYALLPQEREELNLKRHFAMMCFLILDVTLNRWKERSTYAECSVAVLPSEGWRSQREEFDLMRRVNFANETVGGS